MKYEVLETCLAGKRMCRKGEIVEFGCEVKNKYLKPVEESVKITKPVKNDDQKAFSSIGGKPKLNTGMAATGEKTSKKKGKDK